MAELRETIADRLKSARLDKGWTQDEVAERLGLVRSSYAHYETGRNLITVEHLVKLQDILDKPVNYFLGLGTGQLSAEESEWLEIYRALPHSLAKEYAMVIIRGLLRELRDDQESAGT